jgi:hypothetical protein
MVIQYNFVFLPGFQYQCSLEIIVELLRQNGGPLHLYEWFNVFWSLFGNGMHSRMHHQKIE